jgi:uncharacterized phage protein (TIGR02218 family)
VGGQIHQIREPEETMKDASPELQTLLANGGPFFMADCYTFILKDGTTLRYNASDVDVILDGNTYFAHQVLVSGLKYSVEVGVTVDEQEITIAARDEDQVNGVPVLVALANKAFDQATIRRDRAFLTDWTQQAVGSVNLFHGRMSTIDEIGATAAQVKVKSDVVLLNIDFPRNYYQPSCNLVFCSPLCGVNKAAISVAGAATGGDNSTIEWAGATDSLFDQGIITFSSGANADVSATVKRSDGSALHLIYPLEQSVQAGDEFTACPGCAHTKEDCLKWGGNFRGFRFVPPPVTAA